MKLQFLLTLIVLACVCQSRSVLAQTYVDNVVIVLDASGSMDDSLGSVRKIDAAKVALKEVLKQIPATVHVGLVVFSADNVPNGQEWIYPLGPRDEAKLTTAINLPKPGGGTPLGAFMKIGADRLLQERQKQFGYGTYRLLAVTDGEATDGKLYEKYAPDIMSRGITLDVIGVGMNHDHPLAKQSHSYRAANDPAALKKAIAEVMAEIGKSKDGAVSGDVEEGYRMISALPDGFAEAAIKALSDSGNQPIGEKSKTAVQTAPTTEASPSESNGFIIAFIAIVGVILLIIIIINALE